MSHSKLEKMSRYSCNTPPETWLTDDDRFVLEHKLPLTSTTEEVRQLRAALEYVFGDDSALPCQPYDPYVVEEPSETGPYLMYIPCPHYCDGDPHRVFDLHAGSCPRYGNNQPPF